MSVLFRNATVIDGTGCEGHISSVLTDGAFIVAEGNIDGVDATETIDATGKVLCPGFMDIHAHSDLEILRNPSMPHKIQQGITFDLSGNCGIGVFPRKADARPIFADILGHHSTWNWTDFPSYASKVDSGMNIAFLQSHSCLRFQAMEGNASRAATASEIQMMCSLLDNSLSQGCFGLSTGLYYAPCLFADRAELVALLKVVKKHNALFAVHHRCEGDEILPSIDEVLDLVRETGVRLEISHLKAIGRNNQDKVPQVLEKIHQLRDEGFDVAFDQYPYEYGSTSLFSLLPPELLALSPQALSETLSEALTDRALRNRIAGQMLHPEGWDSIAELCPWEDISIVTLESSPQFDGLRMKDAAEKLGMDGFDALFYLLSRETGCALMTDVTQSKDSLRTIFSDPLMCFGTDALYTGPAAHPRSANAAVHLLCGFCKSEGFPLEEAIAKMTGKVAEPLGLKDRGFVRKGCRADLVVLDMERLQDNSDIRRPFEMCCGLEHVMVNGVFAMKNGSLTGSRSGEVILAR